MTVLTLADRAIRWYDANARDLPWRRVDTSAWAVLVSEVMLQQTPVARVIPVWEMWLSQWPTPARLAMAPSGEAIRAWGRLGYPRRALRLHQCATALVAEHNGEVPTDLAALLALPGVGDYTARAVAAFAFGQRHPVVDTNVRRLAARAAQGRPDGGSATTMADLLSVDALLPAKPHRAARASAALMELGALVCTARNPFCSDCPLRMICKWQAAGQPAEPTQPGRRSQTYAGTDRQVRGLLLGVVRDRHTPVPREDLNAVWPHVEQRQRALLGLVHDGLLTQTSTGYFALPGTT